MFILLNFFQLWNRNFPLLFEVFCTACTEIENLSYYSVLLSIRTKGTEPLFNF